MVEWEKILRPLLAKAQKGDRDAMAQLRDRLMDSDELWGIIASPARSLLAVQLEAFFGENLVLREATERHMKAMRMEMAGEGSTPLERILADRVAVCWLQVQAVDAFVAQLANTTLAVAEYHQRRQDRAHRRFLSACKTLAVVRRLAIPALQVNIAEKQVNIAAANAPAARPAAVTPGPAAPAELAPPKSK